MKESSRIRFNPGTGEIEIGGSETFVKVYFTKLQRLLVNPAGEPAAEPKAAIMRKKVKAASGKVKARSREKLGKAANKKPAPKRVTHFDTIVELIQSNAQGISTAALKEQTGLAESQIWNIVNRATKDGKIRKLKRGLYAAA
jgi:hypothetical protein